MERTTTNTSRLMGSVEPSRNLRRGLGPLRVRLGRTSSNGPNMTGCCTSEAASAHRPGRHLRKVRCTPTNGCVPIQHRSTPSQSSELKQLRLYAPRLSLHAVEAEEAVPLITLFFALADNPTANVLFALYPLWHKPVQENNERGSILEDCTQHTDWRGRWARTRNRS